jgi:hypothetical protein
MVALCKTRLIDFAAYTTTIDVNGPFRILGFPEDQLLSRTSCRPAVFGYLPTTLPKRSRVFVPEQPSWLCTVVVLFPLWQPYGEGR